MKIWPISQRVHAGMRERLRQVGGQLEVEASDCSTTVRTIVPLPGNAVVRRLELRLSRLPDADTLSSSSIGKRFSL